MKENKKNRHVWNGFRTQYNQNKKPMKFLTKSPISLMYEWKENEENIIIMEDFPIVRASYHRILFARAPGG